MAFPGSPPRARARSRVGLIFSRLRRFNDARKVAWFEQLAAERLVARYVRAQPLRRLERISGRRAEAFDAMLR